MQETPFVPRGGPEHPYALYTQNTVPEEEDEDITAGGIPVGFPGAANYQRPAGSSNSEVGDIVGSDGHVEQLPPYTRYADNTVAKGNMEHLDRAEPTVTAESSSSSSQAAAAAAPEAPSESTSAERLQPTEPFDVEGEQARKEGWRRTAQKKMCGVMPLWCLLVIIVVIIIAGTIGGVIGGVVGNQQGAARAIAGGLVNLISLIKTNV